LTLKFSATVQESQRSAPTDECCCFFTATEFASEFVLKNRDNVAYLTW